MTGVVIAWFTEVVLITYRAMRKPTTTSSAVNSSVNNTVGGLPLPSEYLATFVIFGTLSLFSGNAEKPATVAAWGYVIATALNLFDPTFSSAGSKVTNTSTGTTATNPVNPSATAGNGQYPIAARPPTASPVFQ